MNTPIIDFVKQYAESNKIRLHMPGHKGNGFLGCEKWDITEIEGADVLYNAQGVIKQSQNNAAALFESKKTLYSAEGSSLSIRAMLYLVKTYGEKAGKRPLVFAGRNAHKVFVTASALLDFDIKWLLPESNEALISCNITADYLDKTLKNAEEKPIAVYVTSPDYLGNILNISELSKICKNHGVLLLVDNAHGAYLKFLAEDIHPMRLGADMCCDSAHKTLPVITGGGYLHISKTAPEYLVSQAENAMALFASTSPSYLILQSLDMANKYIADGYRERLSAFAAEVEKLKVKLSAKGFKLSSNEPLKLTIAPKAYGYCGTELAEILFKKGIVCEFSDPDYIVFMLTPEVGADGLSALSEALLSIEKRAEITACPPTLSIGKRKMSLKEALFSPSAEQNVENCLGKIMASPTVNCPPAIPVVVCGEEIDKNAIKCFKYYGIKTCQTVEIQ